MAEEDNVQISKSELATLRAIQAMMDNAWRSKEHGPTLRKTLKALNPQLAVPEDVADQFAEPLKGQISEVEKENKALKDRLDKWEQSQKDRDEEGTLKSQLESIKNEYGFDDAGMEKVIARMRDKKNPDVESAAAYVASKAPKPKPVTDSMAFGAPSPANLFGSAEKDEKLELLHTDPWKFFDTEARAAWEETAA